MSGDDVPTKARGDGWFTNALAVACVALAVLVILLAVQNRSLKRELADTHGALDRPTLEVGDEVGALTVADDDGASYALDWSANSRSVVLVFTSTCPACAETLPTWDALAGRLAGRGNVRIVGIQLDRGLPSSGASAAIPQGAHPFPIYGIEREANRAFLDLVPYIPATIVVDATGTVREARFGVLDDDAVDAVVAAVTPGAR